jgi:UDP-N-acetylglucosamine 4,6-dehydratase
MESLKNASILITGGTGSFGKSFVRYALDNLNPSRLVVFSRDELKQFEMRQQFPESKYPNLRFFIGDVRDKERLYRAVDGVDVLVHAAALKQVPACEYNPLEAIKTNVIGAANIVDAAIDRNVKKVLALSTDKAANPINLYGATKLCSDKLFVAANSYSGFHSTRFSVVRYGNVVGSRGSVIPYFLAQKATGTLTITDPRMTRFLITLDQGVKFVIDSMIRMRGGEIFVPKIPSVKVTDLARVVAPDCEQKVIGIRPGEKLHEVMVSEDDARNSLEFDGHYLIQPSHPSWDADRFKQDLGGKPCEDGFSYCSDSNPEWLSDDQIGGLIDMVNAGPMTTDVKPKVDEPSFFSGA